MQQNPMLVEERLIDLPKRYFFQAKQRKSHPREVEKRLAGLEKVLGVTFQDKKYLKEVITYSLFYVGCLDGRCYGARLEFLGEMVLGLIVAEILFEPLPKIIKEDQLRAWQNWLTDNQTLIILAKKLAITDYLSITPKEWQKMNNMTQELILVSIFKAIIGAIYRDGGHETVKEFLQPHLLTHIQEMKHLEMYPNPEN